MQTKNGTSDYIYILLKWKKFILINSLIFLIVITGLVFLIPNEYKSTATITLPPESSMGMAGIGGLLTGGSKSSATSIGSKLLGISSTSEDVLLGFMNSRTALTDVINKYHLKEYYENDNMDKVLKALRGDVAFQTNEYGMIDINVTNKDPQLAAKIANYFSELVDSMNISFNTKAAKNNRLFIEKRYFENVSQLRVLEDSMYRFQKKYGVFAIPEQLEAAIKASAEIETQLFQKQIATDYIKTQYGESSPQFSVANEQLQYLKKKVSELKNSSHLSTESTVLLPFKEAPAMTLEYFRIYRSLEVQAKLMEFILPMYEQAKVEEQKSIPTVMIVDKAVPPTIKDSPRRSLIIGGLFSVFFFFLILISYRGETSINRIEYRNPFEEKESIRFKKIAEFFRIR